MSLKFWYAESTTTSGWKWQSGIGKENNLVDGGTVEIQTLSVPLNVDVSDGELCSRSSGSVLSWTHVIDRLVTDKKGDRTRTYKNRQGNTKYELRFRKENHTRDVSFGGKHPINFKIKILGLENPTLAKDSGDVYSSTRKQKLVMKTVTGDEIKLARARQEVDFLSKLNHRNIVKIVSALDHGDKIQYVLHEAPGMELWKLIHEKKYSFSEYEASQLAEQLFGAIAHMHNRGVVHRDTPPKSHPHS